MPQFYEILIIRHRIRQAKKEMFEYKDIMKTDTRFLQASKRLYDNSRMKLLDIVFEHSAILSDNEYLTLMNLKWILLLFRKSRKGVNTKVILKDELQQIHGSSNRSRVKLEEVMGRLLWKWRSSRSSKELENS